MGSEDRDAILTAATELFARFGFRKTSFEDVARRSRIGKGTVYLHFESKEHRLRLSLRNHGPRARGGARPVRVDH